jgi:kinesin family protein 5
MALTTPGSKHIPFRNSKLTLILKESLGGNSKTTLLCTASRRCLHTEESTQTLYFASRAKAIKNACKSNVQLGPKELQYLVDHMKKEIFSLRGQLKKAGHNFLQIVDPKLLAFIGNDFEMNDDGDFSGASESVSNDSVDNLKRKRVSLINLSEKDIIIKYCELRAKYDNLLENAGNTIYKLNQATSSIETSAELLNLRRETDQKLQEIVDSKNVEINNLLEQIESIKKENEKKQDNLNKRIQDLVKQKIVNDEELETSKKDYESLQEMFNLTQNDISYFQEKVTKKKKKISNFKEEIKTLNAEIANKSETITDLNKTISSSETKNLEITQKVNELTNTNEMLLIEIDQLKNLLKQREESESLQKDKNKDLQDENNKHLETLLEKDKKINDLTCKYSELEMVSKNEKQCLLDKDAFNQSQIESLKKENDNLLKLMQEKISDESILAEKEKILSETKSTLEKRIDSLVGENDKLKTEVITLTSKFNMEKAELSNQINNLQIQIKTITQENEQKFFEMENLKKSDEEKIKSESQKSEQLKNRLDQAEKKIYDLEANIITLNENEKTQINDKEKLEKEVRERTCQIEDLKENLQRSISNADKLEKELASCKDNFYETKNKFKEDLETEKKKLLGEQANLMAEVEFRTKKFEDGEQKINELKAEIKVLQNLNQSLNKRINELELDNSRTKRVSTILQKETHTIKKEAPINKNIFGVILKKTDNNIIKQAIMDNEKAMKEAENIFKDKIDEFKKYKQNIISLSPKTVSSRSDIDDIPEIDFTDEETFKKAEILLLEKEMQYAEEKKKKESPMKEAKV